MTELSPRNQEANHWPHRVAIVLACATFPLIWVGGLVTTYDAGMAVPDWPSTYGYNLFLYPLETWVAGPFDLFIEHGHRLLGATVGLLTMALVASMFFWESRRWLRWLALVALVLVIVQGVLGGQRVLLDSRQLALIHGCVAQVFFCLCAALCVVTSRPWREARVYRPSSSANLLGLSLMIVVCGFGQLFLGANLRHVPVDASPQSFSTFVFFHLVMALVLLVGSLVLVWRVHRSISELDPADRGWLRRPARLLCALIVIQISLGAATWVAKYAWPSAMAGYEFAAAHTVQAQGLVPALIVTGHVATGALVLTTALVVALRCCRVLRLPANHNQLSSTTAMELLA